MKKLNYTKLWPTTVMTGYIDKELAKQLFLDITTEGYNSEDKCDVLNLFSLEYESLQKFRKNHLIPYIKEYIKEVLNIENNYDLKVYAWPQYLQKGMNVGIHNHPGNHISGTLWLNDSDAHLLMVDPRGNANMMDFGYVDLENLIKKGIALEKVKTNPTGSAYYAKDWLYGNKDLYGDYVDYQVSSDKDTSKVTYSIKPEIGKFVIFPSYIWHEVEPNISNMPRVSISWDAKIVPKTGNEKVYV